MAVTKPTPGGDVDIWGPILNDALDALDANAESRIPKATLTGKGQLLAATAAGAISALPAGTDGQLLTADSATSRGLRWGDPLAAGSSALWPTRRNLVANPGFEVDLTGWAPNSGSTLCTIARSTTWKYAGAASVAQTCGGLAQAVFFTSGPPYIPVAPGNTYTLSAYNRAATVARNTRVELTLFDAANAVVSVQTGTYVTNSTSADTRVSITYTMPAGVVAVSARALVTGAANGEVHYWDGFLLEETATAGAYFDGSYPGYEWSGAANNSASRDVKPAPTPGATLIDLDNNRRWHGIRAAAVNYWAPEPGAVVARLRAATVQNIPSGIAPTAVIMDTEDTDLLGCFTPSASATRYQPTVPGYYQLFGGVSLAINATGWRSAYWLQNGTAVGYSTVTAAPAPSAYTQVSPRVAVVLLNGTTGYVELAAAHLAGIDLATSSNAKDACGMVVVYVGPPSP
jgi:Carbohydrate binding domain